MSSTWNLDDGGDKEPTKNTTKKPHIVDTSINRKREGKK